MSTKPENLLVLSIVLSIEITHARETSVFPFVYKYVSETLLRSLLKIPIYAPRCVFLLRKLLFDKFKVSELEVMMLSIDINDD